MLERVTAQTEKLNKQLVNAGYDIKKRKLLKGHVQQITGNIFFYTFLFKLYV